MYQRFIHYNENGVIFYHTYWLTWLACLAKVDMKNPKKDEALSFKKETDPVALALSFDPFFITFTRKSIKYLTPLTVEHIPLEISRFVHLFWREVENWRQRYIEQSVRNLQFHGWLRDSYTSDFQN